MDDTVQPVLLTGEQYLQSRRDGRRVYINGKRVADVTARPAFRNAPRSVARLYDALHDPSQRDVLLDIDLHAADDILRRLRSCHRGLHCGRR